MNLKQYVKDNPTQTLEEIKQYFTHIRLTKNEAVNHDATFGVTEIMDKVIADTSEGLHPKLKVAARVFKAVAGGLLESVDMNDATSQGALALLVADGRYTDPMKKDVLDRAKNYPFKNINQADFDKVKLELNPTTFEVSYPSEDFILNKYREVVSVKVTITEALPYDDIITFVCESGNTELVDDVATTVYSQNQQQRAVIIIPANYVGDRDTTINLTGLENKVKAFGTSKFNRPFTAKIYNPVG